MILAFFERLLQIFVNSLDGTSCTMYLLFLTELQYVSRLLFKKSHVDSSNINHIYPRILLAILCYGPCYFAQCRDQAYGPAVPLTNDRTFLNYYYFLKNCCFHFIDRKVILNASLTCQLWSIAQQGTYCVGETDPNQLKGLCFLF